MALRIRLSLRGCLNRPFYHIVVVHSKKRRDGKPLEQVGCYDPMPNSNGELVVGLNHDRIKYWLSVGAQPTVPVYKLLGLSGLLPVHPRLYLDASRARAASVAAASENTQRSKDQPDNEDSTSQDIEQSTTS